MLCYLFCQTAYVARQKGHIIMKKKKTVKKPGKKTVPFISRAISFSDE